MIGELVNKVCDRFDRQSKTELPSYIIGRLGNVFGCIFYISFGATLLALILALINAGVLSGLISFLFPIQSGFWASTWAFSWHWGLIFFYAMLVIAGWFSPKEK